ncbi:hypothetical protein AAG906_014438 [Vitis piasezkii]
MVTAIRFQKTVIVCGITLYEDEDSETPLAPSELGTAVIEAGAIASIGNYALKQPSTVYGVRTSTLKLPVPRGSLVLLHPCFIMLPHYMEKLTDSEDESTWALSLADGPPLALLRTALLQLGACATRYGNICFHNIVNFFIICHARNIFFILTPKVRWD